MPTAGPPVTVTPGIGEVGSAVPALPAPVQQAQAAPSAQPGFDF